MTAPPRRVAIIGSRKYPQWEAVRAYVSGLSPDTVVISGGARGVDTFAMNAARRYGLAVEIYEPDYRTHGKAAPHIRNRQIVECADTVVAFWDGISPGTARMIGMARKAGKLGQVFLAGAE